MVGSVQQPGDSGHVKDVSRKQNVTRTEDNEYSLETSTSRPDEFSGGTMAKLSQMVSSALPDIVPSEKRVPPQPNNQALRMRLIELGRSDEEIDQIMQQTRSRDIAGLPSLGDYASNDRYELRERSFEHHHRVNGGMDLQALHADQELSEMFQKMQERNMLDMQEDQELAKVFLAMSAIAYNPKYAVRQLASLAGSLHTPAAVQFASGQLSNATSFAIKWAMKVAKQDPEFAKDLAKALQGIVVSATNHTNDFAHIHIGAAHEGDAGAHVPDHPHTEAVTEESVVEVVDRHTGDVVDSFVVEVHTHEVSEAYQQAHADSHVDAGTALDDAADAADSTARDAQRIHDEHVDIQFTEVQNANKVRDLDRQLVQSKNDPEEVSNLAQEKSDTLSQGRFIASA
ncbi:MAG: hypothetical protein HYR97_00625 [Candidatus Melainabacteria bacterium]|nr:hypothetical protein [Candidatus Melainabacteria bacterium]MBI3309553.1 hypothetical protein [Candidatus Melainabacteria bacterium]